MDTLIGFVKIVLFQ